MVSRKPRREKNETYFEPTHKIMWLISNTNYNMLRKENQSYVDIA